MSKTSIKKNLYCYFISMIMSVIIITIIYFLMNGIPLFGVPQIEDVSHVEISDTRLDINARKFTKIEDIENAINLINLISHKLGSPEQDEPLIEFVFYLKGGNSFSVRSNEKTVYNNGKAYKLKGNSGRVFIKLTEGVFFLDDLAEKEESK